MKIRKLKAERNYRDGILFNKCYSKESEIKMGPGPKRSPNKRISRPGWQAQGVCQENGGSPNKEISWPAARSHGARESVKKMEGVPTKEYPGQKS